MQTIANGGGKNRILLGDPLTAAFFFQLLALQESLCLTGEF